jgi:uncharacterized membrane protein
MTEKSPERLVFFTDAVVAIALTLLVLPLTEIVPELVAAHGEPIEAITQNQPKIWSFLLSFAVIGRQWLGHHRLFEHVRAYNHTLMLTNMVWLLSVIVMPFATQLVGGFGTDEFACLLYIGTIVVNSGCISLMTLTVQSNPKLLNEGERLSGRWLYNTLGTTIAMLAGVVIVLLVPAVNYYSLLLLLVPPVVARLVHPEPTKPIKLSE